MRDKVTIIGAGGVGACCAQRVAEKGYADVVLMDIIEGLAEGKALDLLQCSPIAHTDTHLIGTSSYEPTANSDVVVVTAGIGRKPGMSREELVQKNKDIVAGIIEKVAKHSPKCILVMVTNPLDAMVWLAMHVSGFPRNRVVGQGGALDGARFRSFVAQELGVSVRDISACILGAHGDSMVPVPRLCTVGGIPITQLMPKEKIDEIIKRTINGGAEITALQKSSAVFAPGAAAAYMVDAIMLDKKDVLPCAAYLDGEYGIHGVVGVPVKLGRQGIEKVIEIELEQAEMKALHASAEAVRKVAELMGLEDKAK